MRGGSRCRRWGISASKRRIGMLAAAHPSWQDAVLRNPGKGAANPMDAKLIEELARKLAGSLPPGMRAVREDIEQNFRAVLQAGLTRMDLVTREEFEVQQRVLERSREKLAALESRIAELEAGKAATH